MYNPFRLEKRERERGGERKGEIERENVWEKSLRVQNIDFAECLRQWLRKRSRFSEYLSGREARQRDSFVFKAIVKTLSFNAIVNVDLSPAVGSVSWRMIIRVVNLTFHQLRGRREIQRGREGEGKSLYVNPWSRIDFVSDGTKILSICSTMHTYRSIRCVVYLAIALCVWSRSDPRVSILFSNLHAV